MADDDGFVRITLRLPTDLHRQLGEAAARKRSMNAEIIARLENSFIRYTTADNLPERFDDGPEIGEMVSALGNLSPRNRTAFMVMLQIMQGEEGE